MPDVPSRSVLWEPQESPGDSVAQSNKVEPRHEHFSREQSETVTQLLPTQLSGVPRRSFGEKVGEFGKNNPTKDEVLKAAFLVTSPFPSDPGVVVPASSRKPSS